MDFGDGRWLVAAIRAHPWPRLPALRGSANSGAVVDVMALRRSLPARGPIHGHVADIEWCACKRMTPTSPLWVSTALHRLLPHPPHGPTGARRRRTPWTGR